MRKKPLKKKRQSWQVKVDWSNLSFDEVNKDLPFHLAEHNSDKPLFSFVGPAIKDFMYVDFYKSVYSQHVPFEIVFVGFKPPLEKMPPNFRYIKTEVNPSQCMEISARYAIGEYLILAADDCRYNANFLEKLAQLCASKDMDNTYIFLGLPKSLPCLVSDTLVIKKSIWHKMGGLDRRSFYMGTYDFTGCTDMQLRLNTSGMEIFHSGECHHRALDGTATYIGDTGIKRGTLRAEEKLGNNPLSFWGKSNNADKRLISFEPYDDIDILTKDQGEIDGS